VCIEIDVIIASTFPFYILHINLLFPGIVGDYEGNNNLLNVMCDLNQLVATVGFSNISVAALLVSLFERVLLMFGLCGLMVIDVWSKFKGIIKKTCEIF